MRSDIPRDILHNDAGTGILMAHRNEGDEQSKDVVQHQIGWALEAYAVDLQ